MNALPPPRHPRFTWGLLLLAIAAAALSLAVGSSGFGYGSADIVWQVRAPRVLAGFGAGAALALAGALMQLLTRNPLADPYVLGLSGGASVGAMLAMLYAPAAVAALAVMLGAAAGAAAAVALLFALAWRILGRTGTLQPPGEARSTLLLIGVMIGAGCSAAVSLLLVLAPDAPLRGLIFWLLGDLNGALLWWPVWVALPLALALAWGHADDLALLAHGDAWAASLGVPVARCKRRALAAAALATGAAVATAGAIGFVGLVLPQALRLMGVRAVKPLLLGSALSGGAFIVLADAVARTVAAPLQLPVGVISAAVGVPVFLALLVSGAGGGVGGGGGGIGRGQGRRSGGASGGATGSGR
jgi:iron complex transport system permease protein